MNLREGNHEVGLVDLFRSGGISLLSRISGTAYWRDGKFDVVGSVDLKGLGLRELPVEFGVVTGAFDCSHNQLESLVGSPIKCRTFRCAHNKLVSLVGGPAEVEKNYDCQSNFLVDLSGAPVEIGGWFDCGENLLERLVGGPVLVGGSFYCDGNRLESLVGGPETVGRSYLCSNNPKLFSEEDIRAVTNVGGICWVSELVM